MFGEKTAGCALAVLGLLLAGCSTAWNGVDDMVAMVDSLNPVNDVKLQKMLLLQYVGTMKKPCFSSGDSFVIENERCIRFSSGNSGDYFEYGAKKGTFSLGDDCALKIMDLSGNQRSDLEYWLIECGGISYCLSQPMTKPLGEEGLFALWTGSGMEVVFYSDGKVVFEGINGTFRNSSGILNPSSGGISFQMFYNGDRVFGKCRGLSSASLPLG